MAPFDTAWVIIVAAADDAATALGAGDRPPPPPLRLSLFFGEEEWEGDLTATATADAAATCCFANTLGIIIILVEGELDGLWCRVVASPLLSGSIKGAEELPVEVVVALPSW